MVRRAIQWLESQNPAMLLLGLGGATLVLLLAGVIGGLSVADDDEAELTVGRDSGVTTTTDDIDYGLPEETTAPTDMTETTVPGTPGPTTAGPGTGSGGTGGGTGGGGGGGGGGGSTTNTQRPSEPGADRTGVSAGEVKWGLHAPKTFDGQPLNLAEDPLEGVDIYLKALNDAGGIHGRKIRQVFADDRYTVEGGKAAADKLINDEKVFFVSGTLGVDQVAQVATEAKKRRVPYMAAGGPEDVFGDLQMFQIAGSYDSHLEKLADMLGAETKRAGSYYFGLKKVGVSSLDTPYILPSVEGRFKRALERNGLELVEVVKVKKPTEQTSYDLQIQQLKNKGAEIVVPTQDPITTAREVQQCANSCNWKWAISNFAHDFDVALTLMANTWAGVRGLSGGCYYLRGETNGPDITNECGALNRARRIWEQQNGTGDYQKDGQGGLAGYQIVHFWVKALKDAGADPTRERLRAALLAYENYNDLVSEPLTFKGSRTIAHGADRFVTYEATNTPGPPGSNNTASWKQISSGFVSSY